MKATAATLLLTVMLLAAPAQATDSTRVQREHYNQLYNQNLISNIQHKRLKARILQIPLEMSNDFDSASAVKLKERFNTSITTGSCPWWA